MIHWNVLTDESYVLQHMMAIQQFNNHNVRVWNLSYLGHDRNWQHEIAKPCDRTSDESDSYVRSIIQCASKWGDHSLNKLGDFLPCNCMEYPQSMKYICESYTFAWPLTIGHSMPNLLLVGSKHGA